MVPALASEGPGPYLAAPAEVPKLFCYGTDLASEILLARSSYYIPKAGFKSKNWPIRLIYAAWKALLLPSFWLKSIFSTLKFGIKQRYSPIWESMIWYWKYGKIARENTGFHREYVNLRKCISIALLLSLASACLFDFDVIAVIADG